MAEVKFTKGPWEIRKHGNGFLDIVADVCIVDGMDCWQGIATMNESDGLARKNAALIIAAPAMYEAMQICLRFVEAYGTAEEKYKVRAALALAEGKKE